jgi:transposase
MTGRLHVSCERRVPAAHSLRSILPLVDGVLAGLSPAFQQLYALKGRPSIPPEKLLRALLLQAFYSVRSERQLMEQLNYNLLFRWFVGLGADEAVWDVTVFTKNRDQLLEGEIAAKFFAAVLARPELEALLSDEYFSVDGTLIQAWASMKSFRLKDGSGEPPAPGRNGERDSKGEKRSNDTHASTSDADARLFRKGDGEASRLCFIGHVLMENRNGLAVGGVLTRAVGTAEASAALHLAQGLAPGPKTLGADKGYDSRDLVMELRELGVTPHVAQNAYATERATRHLAIDGRTTRHPGYALSQKKRKRIEEIFD